MPFLAWREEAEQYARETLETRQRVFGEEHVETLKATHFLGAVLREWGQIEEAEKLGAKAVRLGAKVLGPQHWAMGQILFRHGQALLAMKRHEEASGELEKGYSILVDTRGEDDDRTREVLPHLVACYKAWHEADPDAGHDKKLAEWQAKLDAGEEK